jgi:hypothetical protein
MSNICLFSGFSGFAMNVNTPKHAVTCVSVKYYEVMFNLAEMTQRKHIGKSLEMHI